jgi:S1-C subfamily serine protease
MNMLSEFLESGAQRAIFGLFMEKRKDEKGSHLYVNGIIQGSHAERYGIRIGDKITELNKKKIKEGMKLHSLIRSVGLYDSIQLKIMRVSKASLVNVDIKDIEGYRPSPIDEGLCGFRAVDIRGYPKLKFKLRERDGIVVTKIYKGGLGEKCGLRTGDVIIKINNNAISNKKDFDSFMIEGLKRNYILYQVKRGEDIFFLPVKLDTLL